MFRIVITKFVSSGVIYGLDLESNVVFGEGGAGLFDGKIYTRKRDGELGFFQRLVDFGADPEILEEGWAHLGTDGSVPTLPNLRQFTY